MYKDILDEALIPKNMQKYCYVVGEMIYTPLYDADGALLKDGKEVYFESQIQPPIFNKP